MNTPDNTWGLPREVIPWGPTIDGGGCRGSGECVKFCPNNVYEFDAAEGRARDCRAHPPSGRQGLGTAIVLKNGQRETP